jgi:hypothetical protein
MVLITLHLPKRSDGDHAENIKTAGQKSQFSTKTYLEFLNAKNRGWNEGRSEN